MTKTEPTERQALTELTEAEAEAVRATKALSKKAIENFGDLLKGTRHRSIKSRTRPKDNRTRPDYQGLQGAWATYYKVACAYERKVPVQDRDDLRHDIMVELERAEKRDGKPLPDLRAYRIASLMVALYYRRLNLLTTRVCVRNGLPVEPYCKGCQKKSEGKRCVWLAVRPVERLDGVVMTAEGYSVKLLDTVADDKAIDLVAKLDASDWLLGCKMELIKVASKLDAGIELNRKEQNYLYHFRNRQLKKTQKALF